jgi:hypothetical protein
VGFWVALYRAASTWRRLHRCQGCNRQPPGPGLCKTHGVLLGSCCTSSEKLYCLVLHLLYCHTQCTACAACTACTACVGCSCQLTVVLLLYLM